ncbi:hypothetical protein Lal_00041731 [Lupinus albus]|nr:hypothetical protein Lal_00041731 [Lupinus albus]
MERVCGLIHENPKNPKMKIWLKRKMGKIDFGSSDVANFGSSDVANFGSSDVANFGSSDVANFGSSDVAYFGSSNVASFGSSDVASFGSSDVASFGSSDVASFGSSNIVGFGSSYVASFGSSDFADFLLCLVGQKSILMGLLMNRLGMLVGGGGIFRDHSEDIMGCFAPYYGIDDALYAELLAAILAAWNSVWLECDISLVADIFNEKNFVPWKLRNLWSQCSGIMRLMNIRCSHIFREDNHCADKLATVGVLSKSDLWWNDFNRNRLSFPNYRLKHF